MNKLKRCAAILLSATLVMMGSARPALAASSNVDYVGGAAAFVVLPDNNLWGSMMGLMPGDTATTSIGIANSSAVATDLYLSTSGSPEDNRLLDLLQLRIALVTAGGYEAVLYSGAASGASGSIHLGRYAAGSGATLTAALTIPVTLGNEHQQASGRVVWSFGAVEHHPSSGGGADSGSAGGGSTVVTKTPTLVKVAALGVLPETGSQSKL